MKKLFLILLSFGFPFLINAQVSDDQKRLDSYKSNTTFRFSKVPFRNIGPTIMSGRVTDIDVNPANTIEMVVAYASGGVWYTQNNGQSFRPIFDNEASITIGDIAVDWKSFTIFVGTGENNSSRSSYAGTGVYKTTDTGKTWLHLGLEATHHIGKIIIHPENPQIVYVAAMGHLYTSNEERGVYKSIDGGLSWQRVLFVDENTGIIDLCFDPQNPETLIAASWQRKRTMCSFIGSGPGSGIYLSYSGGLKWTKIFNKENTGRIGLATFVKNSVTGVYAIYDDQNLLPEAPKDTTILTVEDLKKLTSQPKEAILGVSDSKLEAFLRANGFPKDLNSKKIKKLIQTGKHTVWDLINYTGDANRNLFSVNYKGTVIVKTASLNTINWEVVNDSIKDLYYTYGYYFGQIRVAPQNPDELYILGVVLAYSRDGGKHFTMLNDDNVHGDHHALWINPQKSSHLVNGNDGGLNISYDYGKHWVKCNSPAVGQFYAVAVDDAKPYNVYGGLQDNGVWTGPNNYIADNSWHQTGKYPYEFIMGGDGMQVAVDSKNNLVYTGFQFGNEYRLDRKNNTSVFITPRHRLGEKPYRFNWQSPILLSKHKKGVLYFGGNYLFQSTQKGFDWKRSTIDLTGGGNNGNVPCETLTCIDESALKEGLLYTGSDDGVVSISKDAGKNWKNISIENSFPEYKGYWVSRIQASKYSESRVYLTLNGYRNDYFKPMVFVSENYGETWKSISNNLPFEPVNVIREDLINASILYVGTDNGLYVTHNRGAQWDKLSGLPRVAVHDLAIHEKSNEMLVGTHGRSLYIVPLAVINQLDSAILSTNLAFFEIPKQKASSQWGSSNYYWAPAMESNMSFAFYSKDSIDMELEILDVAGLAVFNTKFLAISGLNYMAYNFSVNQNATISKQVCQGANRIYYLKAGKYTAQLKSSDLKVTQTLELFTN
jgi:photosystem II stability/assembly factor-like uncharacterized protein